MPMINPWSMKIVITRFGAVPIVLRMAMSRLFSMTSRMSEATMFSAATMTMRPMVMKMAISITIGLLVIGAAMRGDDDDEADGDGDGHLLDAERREERLVQVGPVLRHVAA